MANPSLQIGNDNWAIKEDNLLGYSTAGTRFVPQPITMTRATLGTRVNPEGLVEDVELLGSELTSPLNFLSTWLQASVDSKTYNTFTVGGSGRGMYFMLPENKTLKINVSGVTGSVQLRYRTTTGGAGTVLGDFDTDLYLTTTNATTNIYLRATGAGTVSVTDVSVKEATIDNLPRVDYTDGTSSLLVEPQRTNLVTYSEDFTQSFYIKDSGVSVGTTNNVSPSGESNATKIDVTDNGRIYANTTSSTYAASVFIKAGTFSYFKFLGSNVDLVAGTYSGGTIESFGNGWFRISKQYTGNRPFQIQAYPDGTYSSHTTTGDYYIWGSQIEEGSYPTSYIKTSGSTVTRNQETYTKTGISNLINSEEGVLFAEISALSNDASYRYMGVTDGSSDNRVIILYYNSNSRIRVLLSSGGTKYFDEFYTVTSVEDFHKVALKWKVNDFALWVDGVERATDTSGSTPIGLNTLALDQAGGDNWFGKVKQLQIFKTALTDSELATLTT